MKQQYHWLVRAGRGCKFNDGVPSPLLMPLGYVYIFHRYELTVHVQWNLSIEDTIGTQLAVLYTVEPLYRGHHWDPADCPVYSGTSL